MQNKFNQNWTTLNTSARKFAWRGSRQSLTIFHISSLLSESIPNKNFRRNWTTFTIFVRTLYRDITLCCVCVRGKKSVWTEAIIGCISTYIDVCYFALVSKYKDIFFPYVTNQHANTKYLYTFTYRCLAVVCMRSIFCRLMPLLHVRIYFARPYCLFSRQCFFFYITFHFKPLTGATFKFLVEDFSSHATERF